MAENLERLVLNLVLPLLACCGPLNSQAAITLKIDAISMYGKLLQAFEDMVIPYSGAILDAIVSQLDQHTKLFNGDSSVDPFEAMVVRELYAELITQSVDVCGSMVLIAPEKLSEKAQVLFEHTAVTLKDVKDINCKYELVELIAQLCMLGLKSGEEQTPEEDFLDYEMRKIQSEDTELQELAKSQQGSSSASSTAETSAVSEPFTSKMFKPLWNAESLSFDSLLSAITECRDLFAKEEYDQDDDDGEEDEEQEEGDNDDEDPTHAPSPALKHPSGSTNAQSSPHGSSSPSHPEGSSNATAASDAGDQTSPSAFEPVSQATKKEGPLHQKHSTSENGSGTLKRRQDESGTGTAIALLSGLSFACMTADQHAQCFHLVHSAMMAKINSAFASSDSYSKLPAMLDALTQFITSASPALVAPHYLALTTLLEDIMKAARIWKSEDPSPLRKRVYSAIRAELLPCYSAVLRQDPESTFAQIDHFMTATTFLLADPMIMADCAAALVSIRNPQQLEAARAKLSDGLLFKMVDSYLRELSNPEATLSMKKTVMQSIGKLAIGTDSLFGKMLEITIPVLLFLGRQVPDLAPTAITSVAQILYAVRHVESAPQSLQKGIDYAIAMVFQFITMSGMELSTNIQKANPASLEITFNFATKERLVDEEEEAEEAEEAEEMMQEDNLADLVYKGECFLMYILHVPELVAILTRLEGPAAFERIFSALLELEEKPTLFEEDSMLKMTAVDIIIFMVEKISHLHSKAHRDKAVAILKDAGIEHFEHELDEAVARLEHITF